MIGGIKSVSCLVSWEPSNLFSLMLNIETPRGLFSLHSFTSCSFWCYDLCSQGLRINDWLISYQVAVEPLHSFTVTFCGGQWALFVCLINGMRTFSCVMQKGMKFKETGRLLNIVSQYKNVLKHSWHWMDSITAFSVKCVG